MSAQSAFHGQSQSRRTRLRRVISKQMAFLALVGDCRAAPLVKKQARGKWNTDMDWFTFTP